MEFQDWMKCSVDPEYGSQAHQRLFIAFLDRLQAKWPCRKDHLEDNPPCHTLACYADKRGELTRATL